MGLVKQDHRNGMVVDTIVDDISYSGDVNLKISRNKNSTLELNECQMEFYGYPLSDSSYLNSSIRKNKRTQINPSLIRIVCFSFWQGTDIKKGATPCSNLC